MFTLLKNLQCLPIATKTKPQLQRPWLDLPCLYLPEFSPPSPSLTGLRPHSVSPTHSAHTDINIWALDVPLPRVLFLLRFGYQPSLFFRISTQMLPAQKGLPSPNHPQVAIPSPRNRVPNFSASKCPWVTDMLFFFLNLCFIIVPFHSMVVPCGKCLVCVISVFWAPVTSGTQVRGPLCTYGWDPSSLYAQEQL